MTAINTHIPAVIPSTGQHNSASNIIHIRHPEYNEMIAQWEVYRDTYNGGQYFIDTYTQKFSKREDDEEYKARVAASYCPAHSKVAVNEIKDAISERLVEVERLGGPATYQKAIHGIDGGVNNAGSTMNGFISGEVIPELLSMGKVGVYVDRPKLNDNITRANDNDNPPYLYIYKAEEILAWKYEDNKLVALLVRAGIFDNDKKTGLPRTTKNEYRLFQVEDDGISLKVYSEAGNEESTMLLALKEIPIAIFEIEQSLMTDIANYQIALLNLGSSDLSYAIKSNFPFYTEQFDSRDMMAAMRKTVDGTSEESGEATNNEVKVGVAQGRKYPKGLDRPGFIHPSPEPLSVSMQKQKDLQEEIKQLVRLSVKSLASSSVDSKLLDERSVESGLAVIGSELERGEREIGQIWADYTDGNIPVIKYPENYTLRTDGERRKEATELEEHITKTPSITMQKELTKQVANILVSHKVSLETMKKIEKEIDDAAVIITDPVTIRDDHEAGLVGTQLASQLRGYPADEVEKAKKDHAERIERIAMSQSKYSVNSANGVDDLDTENDTAKKEKTLSRETDLDDKVTDKTRGDAK